jgi:hypothetical protein
MTGNSLGFGRWLRWGFVVLGIFGSGCLPMSDRATAGKASEVVATGFTLAPRLRYGYSPTLVFMGKQFIGGDLGPHGYYYRRAEKNGMAYTKCGGHIDVSHMRISADWTAFLAAKSYRHLMRGDPVFSYGMLADRSRDEMHLTYPANWSSLSPAQRDPVAREVALILGPYMAYNMVTWHEILTWFGYKSTGIVPEYHSAFSWEDTYSNLLGTVLASRALRDTQHTYNEAMAIAIGEEMRRLGLQSAAVARQASASVRYEWYSGSFGTFINMKKRGLDIGVDTGFVTPILVPNVPGCSGAEPARYPTPRLDDLAQYGFTAIPEILPHEWEKSHILRIVYPNGGSNRIRPDIHYKPIMDEIRLEAIARYGPKVASN